MYNKSTFAECSYFECPFNIDNECTAPTYNLASYVQILRFITMCKDEEIVSRLKWIIIDQTSAILRSYGTDMPKDSTAEEIMLTATVKLPKELATAMISTQAEFEIKNLFLNQ